MSVNPLTCTLSQWDGQAHNCRLCNSPTPVGRKRWCSGQCLKTWRLHHRYFLARQLALRLARAKCACHRSKTEPRHVHCAHCGRCERVLSRLGRTITCDHIIPRNGDKSRFSCRHHIDNLQILCNVCHDVKTDTQDS